MLPTGECIHTGGTDGVWVKASFEDCDEWQINLYEADEGSFTLTNRGGQHMFADLEGWVKAATNETGEIAYQRHVWINEPCDEE